jgi:hypothetical protein
MTDTTATFHHDRPDVEQVIADQNPVQQICHWAMAHKLDACRACIGFRLEDLGLGELVPVLRSRRDGLGSRS